MQSQNRIFDDIARVAGGAIGALSGVRGEIEARLRDQLERVLAGMDLVSREEFEAVKAMAAKARTEQEELLRRIAELEARIEAAGDKTSAADGPPRGKINLSATLPLLYADPFLNRRSRHPGSSPHVAMLRLIPQILGCDPTSPPYLVLPPLSGFGSVALGWRCGSWP